MVFIRFGNWHRFSVFTESNLAVVAFDTRTYKMKVLVIAKGFPPDIGGIETYSAGVALEAVLNLTD